MKTLLNWKVWIGMLATALTLLAVSLVVILAGRPASPADREPASAAMTVIAASTSTPPAQAPTPTLPPTALPSTPTPLPGAFGLGVYVQITGTGGDGLRLRAEPNLGGQPLFLGYDSEVYQVVDGPIAADGHTWWKLTAPYDATRTGWAVQDYLTVIPSP
ncbi:MAG: hypothetical protein FD146_1194 [Anaerolineaceae bacterium]|nr:MAG: hypothetical protein FD146_1194 [Anaerolineaceae bacterium]